MITSLLSVVQVFDHVFTIKILHFLKPKSINYEIIRPPVFIINLEVLYFAYPVWTTSTSSITLFPTNLMALHASILVGSI